MGELADESINLVVTSPPYPMVEMWDDIFAMQNKEIVDRYNALEKCILRQLKIKLQYLSLKNEFKSVDLPALKAPITGMIICVSAISFFYIF